MRLRRWPLDLDASDQGERVRFCLGCGEVMAYALTSCPKCGHANPPAPDAASGPRTPCAACGEPHLASLLFCPACGAPGEEEPSFGVGLVAAPTRPAATGVSLFAVLLALLAPTLALLALLHVLSAGGAPGAGA